MADNPVKPVLERPFRAPPPGTVLIDLRNGQLTREGYNFLLQIAELLEALRKAQTP